MAKWKRDSTGRYRDHRGKFTTEKKYRAAKARAKAKRAVVAPKAKRRTPAERAVTADVRKRTRADVFPAGTEFELTATTKGGTPDRTRHGRIDSGRRARKRSQYK